MSSQPNITRTIKKLEGELGCSLFIRSNRGVALTPEGEKLYNYVKTAVEQIEKGEELLSLDKTLQNGIISVGASEVVLRCFLLPILNEYHKMYPGVHLRISTQPTPQPITALKNGSVDIAIVTTPTGDINNLKVRNIKKYNEIAVCGNDYHKLTDKSITLRELAEYLIISLGAQTKNFDFYRDWFAENGLQFVPDIEVATADQILPLVKNNFGIGFVPEDYLNSENCDGILKLNLTVKIPQRSFCYIKRADHSLSITARKLESMIIGGEL